MVILPASARALIESGPLAHFTTLNADGSPQVAVVWVGVDGDELVTAHMVEQQKLRNVRRDGRVVLSMLGPGSNALGLRDYLVVYGTARVTDGGAAALLQQLAHRYLGPAAEFPPPAVRDRPGFIIRTRVARIAGLGPWMTERA